MKTITEKELTDLLEDGNLCEYCSFVKEGGHSPGALCEGSSCESAKDNYVEKNDLEVI